MNIVLFVIFLFTDLSIVLLCKVSYGKRDEYSQGMLMGVHIPASKLQNETVQQLCKKTQKYWNYFHLINLLIGGFLCVLCFFSFGIFMLLWSIWLFEYSIGLYALILIPHKRLYALKVQNQWIDESNRHKVYIDTSLSSMSSQKVWSWKWHIPLLLLVTFTGIMTFVDSMPTKDDYVDCILWRTTLFISILFLCFHRLIVRKQTIVYSESSEINLTINHMIKHTWTIGLLTASIMNTFSWLYLAFLLITQDWIELSVYMVFFVLQMLTAFLFLLPLLTIQRKKRKILATDSSPLYTDDDEYWKNGWYSNPHDRHILVQDRMNSINLSFNMARPAARIICGIIIVGTIALCLWSFSLVFQTKNIEMQVTSHSNTITISSSGYKCEFTKEEIESITLLDSLPKDSFIRTNGLSSAKNDIGYFKGKETGRCMMFLYKNDLPILQIQLKDIVVFVNSDDSNQIETWYQNLRSDP